MGSIENIAPQPRYRLSSVILYDTWEMSDEHTGRQTVSLLVIYVATSEARTIEKRNTDRWTKNMIAIPFTYRIATHGNSSSQSKICANRPLFQRSSFFGWCGLPGRSLKRSNCAETLQIRHQSSTAHLLKGFIVRHFWKCFVWPFWRIRGGNIP